MRPTDESLLNSYARNRDEKAFNALAARYLGLIFHTALRRTSNRQLAEEVSQNILCALAKKAASLAKNPDLLPAWLHRATLYESSKAMRSEISQQRRKQFQAPDDSAGSSSNWSEAIPHLDQALDTLPESDRHVLLQHFFEGRPFPKIAQVLGKSPAAVQKQSQRALEKLARILRGRGVTLSATAIATGLTSELAKAAPAVLLHSATASVLTGTATYSSTGLTLMFATKSKVFIPLVVLLCTAPLALQELAISHVRARIDHLQTGTLAPQIAEDSRITKVTFNAEPNDLAAWKDLARRLSWMGGDKRIQLELHERLDAMTPDEILEKMDQIATWDLSGIDGLMHALGNAVIEKHPQKILKHFEERLVEFDFNMNRLLVRAFGEWMKTDSSAATGWLDSMLASGKLERHGFGLRTNESCRDQIAAEFSALVIAKQLESGAGLAIQRFLALAPDQQAFIISHGLDFTGEPVGKAGLLAFMRQIFPEDYSQSTASVVEAIHQDSQSHGDEILIRYLENISGNRHIPERTALAAKIKNDMKRGEIMEKLKACLQKSAGEGR